MEIEEDEEPKMEAHIGGACLPLWLWIDLTCVGFMSELVDTGATNI